MGPASPSAPSYEVFKVRFAPQMPNHLKTMYFYLVYFTSFEYRGPAEFQDTLDLPEDSGVTG